MARYASNPIAPPSDGSRFTGAALASQFNELAEAITSGHYHEDRPEGAAKGCLWSRRAGDDIQIMLYDGTVDHEIARWTEADGLRLTASLSGRHGLANIRVFSHTGPGVYAPPSGCRALRVRLQGPGGGGGGVASQRSLNPAAAGGGGGGGYVEHFIIDPEPLYSYAVGLPGVGGVGGQGFVGGGSTGTSTSFVGENTNLYAMSGRGGDGSLGASRGHWDGGLGGNTSWGLITEGGVRGGSGIVADGVVVNVGFGGGSASAPPEFGTGRFAENTAWMPGAGGAGALISQGLGNQTGYSGGGGGPGFISVEEYF